MTADVFGTAALRRAVVEAWLASPTRLREDANTEEDHARGYYRDRVVVELAQNAADAAARAATPGRLRLRLEPVADVGSLGDLGDLSVAGWRLLAANTGAPLDAEGVASLASLRASAKSSGPSHHGHASGGSGGSDAPTHGAEAGPVGRFGVGFAAVRSVSDDVTVRSRAGGVRFSLAATERVLRRLAEGMAPYAVASGTSHVATGEHAPPPGTSADRGGVPAWVSSAVVQRGSALPVLRLPFPAPATGADEPDTVVELVLRDDAAVAAVRAQLAALDDALLLALPALTEVVVEAAGERRVLRDVGDRRLVHRASGGLDVDPDLPLEARRQDWSVLWALPRPGAIDVSGGFGEGPGPAGARRVPAVLHAPTPTDVPLSFPALLVASFPVDPGRRSVLPGATTDRLAAESGRAYAAFLGELAEGGSWVGDVLDLIPAGLPAGELDAAIRAAAADALRDTALLRAVAPDGKPADTDADADTDRADGASADAPLRTARLVAPRDALLLTGPLGEDPAVAAALAPAAPDGSLVALPRRHHALARSLGARTADLADLLDALPAEPETARAAYEALAAHVGDPAVLEALAAAPVPLADGRTARGARGAVLLPADAGRMGDLARALGLRVVHPAAAHPVLARVGALPTTPRALLDDPSVRASALGAAGAILDDRLPPGPRVGAEPWADDAEPDPWAVVEAVLELVRLALADDGSDAAFPFWLGELPVVTADGDLAPLRETTVPGSWAEGAFPGLAPVADDAVGAWGPAVLAAAGAHLDLVVYRVVNVVTPDAGEEPGEDEVAGWLDGWEDYLDHLAGLLGPGAWAGDLEAVGDLDAVAGDDDGHAPTDELARRWREVLARLADDPAARQALLTPVRSPDGTGSAPSYTAWWLRRELGAPFALHRGAPLLPPAPPVVSGLDVPVLRALGGVPDLAAVGPRDWPAVLAALPEAGARLPADVALAVWSGLAGLAQRGRRGGTPPVLDPLPDRLPAMGPGGGITVVDADDLVVAASELGGQLEWADGNAVVPAPADVARAVAEMLDLPLVGDPDDVGRLRADDAGDPRDLDPRVQALAPGLPRTWQAHDRLTVDGREVAWWVDPDGTAHATGEQGLARALAEVSGVDRLLLEAALREPGRAGTLAAEQAWLA
ncbi:ATP-binding protein [Antribacter sp. KLBMP9083]|uniref:ATP-binding protein n=1 Tax=Antribacter soli TaxID=2910976 RepID=A0AA41QEZ7_9MICO|nr:ATP-binding protein [Antribacter soli]MCF4122223.1 ATP-binding protein [Antribacter soli]